MSGTMVRTRSDERQKLHDAIAKHRRAVEYHAQVNDLLQQKSHECYGSLDIAVTAAEAQVVRSQQEEVERLVAELLGPSDQEHVPLPDAEAALVEAQKSLNTARIVRDRLAVEMDKAASRVRFALIDRQRAVQGVVVAEGGALELKRLHDALAAQVVGLRQALNLVSFALPKNMNGQVILGFPPEVQAGPLEQAWKAALLGLETNADFPLPDVPE